MKSKGFIMVHPLGTTNPGKLLFFSTGASLFLLTQAGQHPHRYELMCNTNRFLHHM